VSKVRVTMANNVSFLMNLEFGTSDILWFRIIVTFEERKSLLF